MARGAECGTQGVNALDQRVRTPIRERHREEIRATGDEVAPISNHAPILTRISLRSSGLPAPPGLRRLSIELRDRVRPPAHVALPACASRAICPTLAAKEDQPVAMQGYPGPRNGRGAFASGRRACQFRCRTGADCLLPEALCLWRRHCRSRRSRHRRRPIQISRRCLKAGRGSARSTRQSRAEQAGLQSQGSSGPAACHAGRQAADRQDQAAGRLQG